MELKRGAISYTEDEWDTALKQRKYLNNHHRMTAKVGFTLETLVAQFQSSNFYHSFSLIQTSLVDYFLSRENLLEYEYSQYLYDDLCGWRNNGLIDYLKYENIDLEKFGYKYLKFSDYFFELFTHKAKNGMYELILPDDIKINLSEADFFALSILVFNDIQVTDHKDDGYWFNSPSKALDKWESLPVQQREFINISIFYDKTVHTEYWFSIVNELFLYFQNALIRSGEKIAISKEKSRVAKIKAENYKENNEQAFNHIEELWNTEQWKKASKCAEDIFNLKGIELPYTTVYNHLRSYIKSKK